MDGTFLLTSVDNIQKYTQLQKHLFFNQSLNSPLGFHYYYKDLCFLHTRELLNHQNNLST